MTCEQCTERLSDAVDAALAPGEQAQIDAHCSECEACRDLLNDLMEIRAAAATLDRHAPSAEVWRAISARLERPSHQPSRVAASGRPWIGLAAAAALALMAGAATWFDLASRIPQPDASAVDLARTAASELELAEQHYENAIATLEQLAANKETLDPAVAAEIAESLQSIDRAIDDSRAALETDPDSLVAQTSLLEALRMKVALLQETVSLMNARS
jgi:predicted anti-sigma-YlaC factor YlaD